MDIFNLPDLGEGLPDAEIHEWYVKEGDSVALDQPLVAMETAKAVVDVPCPQEGIIAKLFGKPGDIIKTDAPLVGFEAKTAKNMVRSLDKGTVVGKLEESQNVSDDNFTIGISDVRKRTKAGQSVRLLAKQLAVDLNQLVGSGDHGLITVQDVKQAAEQHQRTKPSMPDGFTSLHGMRRAMLHSMVQSHREVVAVSIFDEVNISHWTSSEDITVRLIQAIVSACRHEPALNAWFNTEYSARRCFDEVHIGLAMDTDEGLFVPVINNAGNYQKKALRQVINDFKKAVCDRSIGAEQLKGATITLSNFGKFAGRFASPIIVPPTVAILAVGRLYQAAAVIDNTIAVHHLLPLSLSFDHRAVTGGEATRFLGVIIDSLQESQGDKFNHKT
jgi:2-oxoisovalerate dehydrogenase E2 component (dihydrolipoyl transacylase)